MADDIFLTPEEQDERARKWLKDNGPALVIGVALGLAAIFGYEQYKTSEQTKAEDASALYAATLEEVNDSSLSDIDAQVAELKKDYAGSPYAAKAALLKAKQLSLTDLDAAYAELQWVVDNASETGVQHTARIRQAKIKLSQGDLEQAKSLGSHTPTQGFESNYAEVLAEVSLKQGDEAAAREYFQKAIDTLPSAQSSYARVLSLKLDRLPEVAVDEAAEPIKVTPGNTEGSDVTENAEGSNTAENAEGSNIEGSIDSVKSSLDEAVSNAETLVDAAADSIDATVDSALEATSEATEATAETVEETVESVQQAKDQ